MIYVIVSVKDQNVDFLRDIIFAVSGGYLEKRVDQKSAGHCGLWKFYYFDKRSLFDQISEQLSIKFVKDLFKRD